MFLEPLSLKSVVLFIAFGCMLFVIVFIFAKRQITRFTLKSRRGPHAAIGEDAPKALKQEIHERLRRVINIKYEPPLSSDALDKTTKLLFTDGKCHYRYRMQAMDKEKLLDSAVESCHGVKRRPGDNIGSFWRTQCSQCNVPSDLVDKFILMYNHARYGHADFTKQHFNDFSRLIGNMIQYVRSGDAVSPTSDDTTDSAEPLVQVTYRARPGRRHSGPGMKMTATSGSGRNISSGSSMDGHAAENAV